MVVLSKTSLEQYPCIRNLKQTTFSSEIPIVDLSKPDAKNLIVKACEEFGFFKVINHGVSMECISLLESEAVKFFSMSIDQKEKAGPANPFGYGNKKIGQNGDIGWVEYLLLTNNQDFNSFKLSPAFGNDSDKLRYVFQLYITLSTSF